MYGNLTNIDEYNLDIIPFDSDLLSLEQPLSFRVSFAVSHTRNGVYMVDDR